MMKQSIIAIKGSKQLMKFLNGKISKNIIHSSWFNP